MKKLYLDIGSNHNQNFARMSALIGAAADLRKEYGYVQGIKLQLFSAERLYAPGTKYSPDVAALKQNELPLDWLPFIADQAAADGLELGVTIFDLETFVKFNAIREKHNITCYLKISSSDLLRTNLIQDCCVMANGMDTHVHISTGGASIGEIDKALRVIADSALKHPIVYHCVMNYPCKPEDAALTRIHVLADLVRKNNYDLIDKYPEAYSLVGYSDHTRSLPVVVKALSWVGTAELHFDLSDEEGSESKYGHCWTKRDVATLCAFLRTQELASLSCDDSERSNAPDLRADPTDGLRPRMKHRGDK